MSISKNEKKSYKTVDSGPLHGIISFKKESTIILGTSIICKKIILDRASKAHAFLPLQNYFGFVKEVNSLTEKFSGKMFVKKFAI